MTKAPLLLRWTRRTGIRSADYREWRLTAWRELSGLRRGRGWAISCDGLTTEAEGSEPTFLKAQRAAEAALRERLTGHERAALAREATGLSAGGEDGLSVRQG